MQDANQASVIAHLPSFFGLSGFARDEPIAVNVVSPGLLFAGCAAKGIYGRADPHIGEPDLLEHFSPACARQASGYSAGPQIDLPQRFRRNRFAVGYVGELQPATRSEHSHCLGKHGLFVGTEVEHAV